MPEKDEPNKIRVFLMDDPALVKDYLRFVKTERRQVSKCFKEVLAATGHEAMLYDMRTYSHLAGIKVNPPNWWETETARKKAEAEAKGEEYHNYWGHADAPIPAGWRRRVKDDYLCPPLKGGGPEAEAARALCKKWSRIEGPRGYLQRLYGIKAEFFAGLSFCTIGIDVLDEKTDTPKLYVISRGPEQNAKTKATNFVEIKHSAYLLAKGE